jgi:hypothetical protein
VLAPGAGHGEEGDASIQGPAQERQDTPQADEEPQPAQPKPAHSDVEFETATAASPAIASAMPNDEPAAVIAFADRLNKTDAAQARAVSSETGGLVTTHPKPAKRKNARERAKEKYAKDGTTPMTAKAKSEAEKKSEKKAKKLAERKARKSKAAKVV